MNRKDAWALDRADPFAKKRKLFKLPTGRIDLDGKSRGVLPKASIAREKHRAGGEGGQRVMTS